MQDDSAHTPRREFLGQLSLIALAASAPASAVHVRVPRSTSGASPWDMSWVERIAGAPYKVVIDSPNLNDGAALDLAADIMNTFHEVYNGPDTQTRVVVVMRQLGAPMALQDSLWDRYTIGEDRKVNDPATKAPARRNPFLHAASGEPSYAVEAKIEPLVARGMTILVCNRAAMNMARSLAEKAKRDVEQVRAEVRNGLVPGATLMPNGIFALVRAQNAGCALMKFS
jgi:intracellular sulfur oxidation DsrE/DsrF family protein